MSSTIPVRPFSSPVQSNPVRVGGCILPANKRLQHDQRPMSGTRPASNRIRGHIDKQMAGGRPYLVLWFGGRWRGRRLGKHQTSRVCKNHRAKGAPKQGLGRVAPRDKLIAPERDTRTHSRTRRRSRVDAILFALILNAPSTVRTEVRSIPYVIPNTLLLTRALGSMFQTSAGFRRVGLFFRTTKTTTYFILYP